MRGAAFRARPLRPSVETATPTARPARRDTDAALPHPQEKKEKKEKKEYRTGKPNRLGQRARQRYYLSLSGADAVIAVICCLLGVSMPLLWRCAPCPH